MATIKQLTTLMTLKTEAGEELDRAAFVGEWLHMPHKVIQAEFKRLNSNRPASDSQLAWIAMLEQKVYGQVYSLGLNLSYQDACERIPLLKLMLKEKRNNQKIEKQIGLGPISEIELLDSKLRVLKEAQAASIVDEKTGERGAAWYQT
jgi:hypothetical protein